MRNLHFQPSSLLWGKALRTAKCMCQKGLLTLNYHRHVNSQQKQPYCQQGLGTLTWHGPGFMGILAGRKQRAVGSSQGFCVPLSWLIFFYNNTCTQIRVSNLCSYDFFLNNYLLLEISLVRQKLKFFSRIYNILYIIYILYTHTAIYH